jgi:hypothetical protein
MLPSRDGRAHGHDGLDAGIGQHDPPGKDLTGQRQDRLGPEIAPGRTHPRQVEPRAQRRALVAELIELIQGEAQVPWPVPDVGRVLKGLAQDLLWSQAALQQGVVAARVADQDGHVAAAGPVAAEVGVVVGRPAQPVRKQDHRVRPLACGRTKDADRHLPVAAEVEPAEDGRLDRAADRRPVGRLSRFGRGGPGDIDCRRGYEDGGNQASCGWGAGRSRGRRRRYPHCFARHRKRVHRSFSARCRRPAGGLRRAACAEARPGGLP